MKKLLLIFTFCFMMCQSGTSTKVRLTDDLKYEFTARYPKSDTGKIQTLLSDELKDGEMSYINNDLDGDLVLNSGMHFYIKSKPGMLKIVFDRTKNSDENFDKIQEIGKKIQRVLGEGQSTKEVS